MEYELIRSRRRTISVSVGLNGEVKVKAPLFTRQSTIDDFLYKKRAWIEDARKRMKIRRDAAEKEGIKKVAFSEEELNNLKKLAKSVIPVEVESMAREMGIDYGRIAIRAQKTRWGSCSYEGNLNFNCLLMQLPVNVRRYVIVHELSHRRHMDHSKAFWAEVEKYHPDYKRDRKMLKTLGPALLNRLPE